MSADLFAAFSQPPTSKTSDNKSLSQSNDVDSGGPEAQIRPGGHEPWILQSRPLQKPLRNEQQEFLWKQDSKGADVLFDASEDEGDQDEFGDFEEVVAEAQSEDSLRSPSTQLQPQKAFNTDLLGLDDFPQLEVTEQQSRPSTSSYQKSDTKGLFATNHGITYHPDQYQSQLINTHDVLAQSRDQTRSAELTEHYETAPQENASMFAEDDWGNFEDFEKDIATKPGIERTQPHATPEINTEITASFDDVWDAFGTDLSTTPVATQKPPNAAISPKTSKPKSDSPSQSQPASSTSSITPSQTSNTPPRPTNVPPPSTLLQLLPGIYHSYSQQSRQSNPPASLGTRILQIYTTTARIISGRTHRWKRDTILSQSMRISQAGLKSTGMKLTALDRSETIKEDQEAQEAITAWQRHAAALNATMLKAKIQKPPMSLGQNMAVRVASGPGVLTAKECCAVCGLKRNERVTGIDVRVEDTFGEFWVEHWGHRVCYEFWYAYEGSLSKR